MSDEIVRVLDENGNYTGEVVSRSLIHDGQIWHEAIHVWVINEKGELLIQKRSSEKKLYANVWHISVAGHVSKDETPLSTALRESAEELGLKVVADDLKFIHRLKVFQAVPETGFEDREFLSIYLLKVDSSSVFKLQSEEVKEVAWIELCQFEAEITDSIKSKKYLNHPSFYYLQTITQVRQMLKS